ncbi:hypothetical protein [Deinococcus deserti]|uniref:Uncharacterized protein n=1 Tax=Deinococcus deserti (strain DSM 17065 / CIP 109153 / LMG 22923 / VCD115) TaxID=546414 RepID=C1CUI4_DEIDV|nr:hypothetical protein [Deinococcus deserti]ACO45851.1 conserved hypothetical protein, precursor [Deinococcus deserti VCD115]
MRQQGRHWHGRSLALAAALLGGAQATNLDFSGAVHSPAGGGWSAGTVRFGVSDVGFAGGTVALGLSTRAADLQFSRGFSLAPLGAVTARTDLAVTWQGGVRTQARVNGALGPVALNVGAALFTTSLASVDPLASYAFQASDLRDRGWNADLTARYRLSRLLVLQGGAELGAQPQAFVGVEGRRDLIRILPPADGSETEPAEPQEAQESDISATSSPASPAVPETSAPQDESAPEEQPDGSAELESDDPAAAEPETEVTGTIIWRLGARAGRDVLGVTAGVGYAAPSGLNLGLDALIGPGSFGVTASLSAADVLGEGTTLRVYGAFEPWRNHTMPLRAGLEATLPAGPGELGLDLRGGQASNGSLGYGARISYSLPLGNSERP